MLTLVKEFPAEAPPKTVRCAVRTPSRQNEVYDVRAFCPKPRERLLRRNLPRRAVEALLHGRYASLGGRTAAKRSRHLVEIASAYTWEELLSEPGVGTVTASEIRLWLEERGASLRLSE